MATVTVDSILKRVNTLLNDRTWVRWPKQELLDYYNDAAKAIVLMRPDAHTKNVQFNCAAGTKQTLPADALRLIEVLRNADGKVIRFVPRGYAKVITLDLGFTLNSPRAADRRGIPEADRAAWCAAYVSGATERYRETLRAWEEAA